jgi:hypothetical protein
VSDGEAERLADSLHHAPDWPARFDRMDLFLLERLRRRRPMSPDVAWALKSLQASDGARSIGALSRLPTGGLSRHGERREFVK